MARATFDKLFPKFTAPSITEKPELKSPHLQDGKKDKKRKLFPKSSVSDSIVSTSSGLPSHRKTSAAKSKINYVEINKTLGQKRSLSESISQSSTSKPRTSITKRILPMREREKLPEGVVPVTPSSLSDNRTGKREREKLPKGVVSVAPSSLSENRKGTREIAQGPSAKRVNSSITKRSSLKETEELPVVLKRTSQAQLSLKNPKKKLKPNTRGSDGHSSLQKEASENDDETPSASKKKTSRGSTSVAGSLADQERKSGESIDDLVAPDRIIALKEIVIQAARDRRIFCIYEGRRYIAQPVREELAKRGWLECIFEKAAIPQKRIATPTDPNKLLQPEPSQVRIDHTAGALVCKDPTDVAYFTISGPDPEGNEFLNNLKICTFGMTHEGVPRASELTKLQIKKTANHPRFDPEDAKTISEHIQSENFPINFFWLSCKPAVQLQYITYSPEIANKFQKTVFCSKYGLWSSLTNYFEVPSGISFPLQYPRMYNPADAVSRATFFFDFHLTSCTSVLLWLVRTAKDRSIPEIISNDGKVPLRAFEFAIKKCEIYMKFKQIGDSLIFDEFQGRDGQWNHFRYWADLITIKNSKLKLVPLSHFNYVKAKSADVLRRMKAYRPYLDIDGVLNLWIVKPYSAACGRGIFLTCNLTYIQQLPSRYIVQKYIERPMLIEGTKFDIRQWLMITSLKPLEIWMYNECYLRFCTQPFNLRNLHESVHLSNNAVQKRYAKDAHLHKQNMWDSTTFKDYLNLRGHGDLWDQRIYPGMRDAIIMALLSCQQTFDTQRNGWFEVYGADFMLTEKMTNGPWLIEINESPAMDPSTSVTARLCQQMLRDVIKVVVDRKTNPKADTGGWERIYKESLEAATILSAERMPN